MVTVANYAVHTAEKRELLGDRGPCCLAAKRELLKEGWINCVVDRSLQP